MPARRAHAGLLVATLALAGSPAARADGGVEFFEAKIRPALAEHCYGCHSVAAKKAKGGLRLDSADGLRKGGDSGPVLATKDGPGLILKAVEYADDAYAMPPKGKLPEAVIRDFQKWAGLGYPLPTDAAAKAGPTTGDSSKDKDFWAFRPAAEHPTPSILRPLWALRHHDHFVMQKLYEQKLTPAPAADPRVLIRRVYFDLIGLPPTPAQVEAFAADGRRDAYDRLVEELLASPRFGEKWGRHWLDVARYAEDHSTGRS